MWFIDLSLGDPRSKTSSFVPPRCSVDPLTRRMNPPRPEGWSGPKENPGGPSESGPRWSTSPGEWREGRPPKPITFDAKNIVKEPNKAYIVRWISQSAKYQVLEVYLMEFDHQADSM